MALPLLCGCTALSGLDDKVFDLAPQGQTGAGGTGTGGDGGGISDGGGGEGGDGGEGGAGGGCTDQVIAFSATDTNHVVPEGMSYVHIKAWGAGGNEECLNMSPDGHGGVGGFTEAVFEVTPGTTLAIIVGDRRTFSALDDAFRRESGFPGRGAGGLSGVFDAPAPEKGTERNGAILIAGGGGGAGVVDGPPSNCKPGGTGNHPTEAGGQVDTMLGQDGSRDINSGGGGWEGGTGGLTDLVAGAGGTGWIRPDGQLGQMLYREKCAPLPPGNLDDDWDGAAGAQENPGRVVLRYYCDEIPAT